MATGVQKLVNKVKSGAREFADSLTPTLKVSECPQAAAPEATAMAYAYGVFVRRNPSSRRVV
jgi:hypothetical protein